MNWFDWLSPRPTRAKNARVQPTNPLAGKPLRYLIGSDDPGEGSEDVITEVPYGHPPVKRGISIGYCNLFDEKNTGRYGPYLRDSDTARDYGEGQIDPHGPGWTQNLVAQFYERKRQGFRYIELDNPDAYEIKFVIGAIELAAQYGLKVIAKNPGLMERGAVEYVAHPNIHGIIVERGGSAFYLDQLRRNAGKPDLPVWFVFFGNPRHQADQIALDAKQFRSMGVTYSSAGEYGSSEDILRPRP